ncbi:MAG: hypothetical protein VKI81_02615, partial [Synechococcaceae cyanobacterium]|nr:hypothetical protein [Synechococcaceae cyanobacterium]
IGDRNRYAECPSDGCVSMVRADGAKFISLAAESMSSGGNAESHPSAMAVYDLRADPYEWCNLIDTSFGNEVREWAVREHSSLAASRCPPSCSPMDSQSGAH